MTETDASATAADTPATAEPIDRCLERWHRFLRREDGIDLDDILHEDVTFWSPIVFSPQQGREITKLYLTAAAGTLAGDGLDEAGTSGTSSAAEPSTSGSSGKFRYVRTIRQGHDALLEFETTMDGLYVNGVDIIRCDDDGRIVDFKVMVRPLKAINAVHAQMRAMLEKLQSG